eukprot:5037617-Pleurochrysis_carterae.AAC.1
MRSPSLAAIGPARARTHARTHARARAHIHLLAVSPPRFVRVDFVARAWQIATSHETLCSSSGAVIGVVVHSLAGVGASQSPFVLHFHSGFGAAVALKSGVIYPRR